MWSFKLLNILPTDTQTCRNSTERPTVKCELLQEYLFHAPKYEALSYTWGSTIQDCQVEIRFIPFASGNPDKRPVANTETVYVTKHLHAALLELQQPAVPRLVWIDQLCIDQANLQERNEQVSIMADIYRRAERTVVWLGETTMLDDDRRAIVNATERMNFRPIEREWSEPRDQDIIKDLIGFKAEGESSELGRRRRQVLADALNRPWFTRAWVFQEVVVAKSGIVLYGSLEMDMDIFINLLDGVCEFDFQDVGAAKSMMRSSKGYRPMFAIREARFESRNGFSSAYKGKFLSTVWQAMGNVDATNPRDKVYAFLAFSDLEAESQISPSYELPIRSVYADATLKSIRSLRSLDALELALKGSDLSTDLPSWVPDFSRPLPSFPFMTHNVGGSNFRASRKIPCPDLTRPGLDRHALAVQGSIISTVSSICPVSFPTFDPSQTLHESLKLDEIASWVVSHTDPPHDRTTIVRTLLAEGAAADDTPNNEDYDSTKALQVYQDGSTLLEAYRAGHVPAPNHVSDTPSVRALKVQYRYYSWMKRVSEIVVRKRVFVTEDGDLGLAYEAIREGDKVCVLLGSRTPTVLREVEDGQWRFVAQCYLNGWMRGEVHEGREWTEEKAESFVLS
ncbi:MAG: hypothetical protein Q9210_005147 [Variospora velana]